MWYIAAGVSNYLILKDQRSANSVRRQLEELVAKSGRISILCTQPERSDLTSGQKKANPRLLINNALFTNDEDNVGYTCRHLYQRIEEHKGSAIGKQVRDQHGMAPSDISLRFKTLLKCQSKLDCLIYEIFFIKEANLEHAVWLHPRKVIFIARSNTIYIFFCKSFYVIVI